ncbi:ras-specific guanine nucleotide-releasing factor 2-like, partial [Limulus polyphemus]|uniref:Ras-specific guanine nucleotide-releasing factor 2-like n=1 Tax=Limulus polyphemus TaxID=6850 RepID=A0ABM1RVU8_LIMPO
LVFRMVEAEEDYLEQLQMLVSYFLRPFKMAASSQKPPCSHDEVNSIFLNSETVMFLHQIFLKGLTSRMESWPTLVLGDLFDMLLPMLTIYQEYVRNHHYSLQVLAECKQREKFNAILHRLEEKSTLQGRTLETFLTYPMHQIPRYIITLHELLAHTPHNHVERKSLETARTKLEELSRQMHDEVSETENIRKNLAIERMITGGCDILLDVNQVFIRQGSVIRNLGTDKSRLQRPRVRECVQQCYLFTNHILLCTRTSAGKLHLVEGSLSSASSQSSGLSEISSVAASSGAGGQKDYGGLDFKIIVDIKNGPPVTIHLVAPTMQEKAAWTSDISQCIDNVHFNDLFHGTMSDSSSVTMPHSIRNDPRLFKDDADIRFSRTLNSCKLPQIRYASPERLFERLTDLRFLSIDFLNTFLLTYRVFTDAVTVLKALKKVHYNPELQLNMLGSSLQDSTGSLDAIPGDSGQTDLGVVYADYDYTRRISTASTVSDVSVTRERELSLSTSDALLQIHQSQQLQAFRNQQHWRLSYRKFEEEQKEQNLKRIRETSPVSPGPEPLTIPIFLPSTPELTVRAAQQKLENGSDEQPEEEEEEIESALLAIPGSSVQSSHSCDTLTPEVSGLSTPTNMSSTTSTATLVGSIGSTESPKVSPTRKAAPQHIPERAPPTRTPEDTPPQTPPSTTSSPVRFQLDKQRQIPPPVLSSQSAPNVMTYLRVRGAVGKRGSSETESGSPSTTPRSSFQTESTILSTPRSSFQYPDSPQHSSKAGVVVTSSRASTRRSSTSSAAAAFAAATAGSSNPPEPPSQPQSRAGSRLPSAAGADLKIPKAKRESMISTAATMRVLNVLRHWVSKHSQDFENDPKLLQLTTDFLEELVHNTNLLPAEHKAAAQILQMITKQDQDKTTKVELDVLLSPPVIPSKETIETLSALELAEGMTFLDHQIFISIRSE